MLRGLALVIIIKDFYQFSSMIKKFLENKAVTYKKKYNKEI